MKVDARIAGILWLGPMLAVAADGDAETSLQIKVVKRAYSHSEPRPFQGVGMFDVVRGTAKMDGANCPDKSNAAGVVRCRLKCDAKSKEVVTLRVQPPTNQDHLAGWVTPTAISVELKGCKLTPSEVIARYEDARFALENTLIGNNFAALSTGVGLGGGGGGQSGAAPAWTAILRNATRNAAFGDVSAAQKSSNGRKALFDVARFATEGSVAYTGDIGRLTAAEAEEKKALAQWEALSKNGLLLSQFERTVPGTTQGARLALSSDPAKYLENLRQADETLAAIKDKTPEQRKLADDIKALRALPAMGFDARPSLQIMQEWK